LQTRQVRLQLLHAAALLLLHSGLQIRQVRLRFFALFLQIRQVRLHFFA